MNDSDVRDWTCESCLKEPAVRVVFDDFHVCDDCDLGIIEDGD